MRPFLFDVLSCTVTVILHTTTTIHNTCAPSKSKRPSCSPLHPLCVFPSSNDCSLCSVLLFWPYILRALQATFPSSKQEVSAQQLKDSPATIARAIGSTHSTLLPLRRLRLLLRVSGFYILASPNRGSFRKISCWFCPVSIVPRSCYDYILLHAILLPSMSSPSRRKSTKLCLWRYHPVPSHHRFGSE